MNTDLKMAKRNHKQSVARQGNQQIVHTSYEEDDNMLPAPEVLQHYQQLDPRFIDWFMKRSDVEQNGRLKFNNDKIKLARSTNRKLFTIDLSSIFVSAFVVCVAIYFSFKVIEIGNVWSGTILGGSAVITFAIKLLNFRKKNTPEK